MPDDVMLLLIFTLAKIRLREQNTSINIEQTLIAIYTPVLKFRYDLAHDDVDG